MQAIQDKMRTAGCSEVQIRRFCARVQHFLSGERVTISESSIEPVQDVVRLDEMSPQPGLLRQVAMVKLNGGLGTSMGLTGPKGSLQIKDGMDFYAICLQQMKSLSQRFGFQPPLIFMNSFSTQRETLARLNALDFKQELPWEFLQSQVPKIKEDGSLPEVEEQFAWCPPGHGDIYASLLDSGLREMLLAAGIKYLFVSNIDNLGAVLDSRALVYMQKHGLAFLMEVTARGENDRKGGHLARGKSGELLLREVAQCPEEDLESFQDIEKHRYFNTNNLWIDLEAVDESWTDLPLIVNRKPVRPHEPESQIVVQLEQAMGAAIGEVTHSGAIEVGRERFIPVKTTNDLFMVRSDLFELSSDFHLLQRSSELPVISLDPEHFAMIDQFESLVEAVPSLRDCKSLRVHGPVKLHSELALKGDVHLTQGSKS